MTRQERAVIVAGGPINSELALQELAFGAQTLVAADGGGSFLYRHGYLPTILVGDFDSLPAEILQVFEARGTEIIAYPTEKDYTDLELAIDLSIQRGAREIVVYGGLGGRLDHTLGNLALMKKAARKGIKVELIGVGERVYLLPPGERITLFPQEGGFFSLLPLSERVEGLTVKGAKYPLTANDLEYGSTLGIHNEFLESPVQITTTAGYLYIIMVESEKAMEAEKTP